MSWLHLGFCEAVAGSREDKAMTVLLRRSNIFPRILNAELFYFWTIYGVASSATLNFPASMPPATELVLNITFFLA